MSLPSPRAFGRASEQISSDCNWQHNVRPQSCNEASRVGRDSLAIQDCPDPRNNTTIRLHIDQNVSIVVSSDQPKCTRLETARCPAGIHAPLLTTDKYAAKTDDMHRYGAWLMGLPPKVHSQFSVWERRAGHYIPSIRSHSSILFLKCSLRVGNPKT